MVTDRLTRLTTGRSRRVVFVALVALMVTIAGCGGAGPSNNTTDGGVGETTDGLDGETTDGAGETTDGVGTGNETTDGVGTGNETTDNGTATDNGTDMNATGTANIRVAHMSPDAPAVDVYVNNETFLEGAEYGNISEYTEVAPGEYNVSITEAGNQSNVVFAENVTVEAANYTVAAIGEIGENATEPFSVLVLQDGTMDEMMESGNMTENGTDMNATETESMNETEDTNASGNASVRIVHASPDAGEESVLVSGTDTALAENVSFGDDPEYVEVPAGEYTLDIVAANDTETVVASVDVTVEADTPYTAFAAGYVMEDAPADAPFEVFVAIDDPELAMTMDDGTTEEGTEEGNTTTTEDGSSALAPLFG
ncbi:DUF4397 domain-containing protein [Halomarina rubra]|uniref:DUF4397 domain-containing protein n=1 Tax=Halomarina rubra TaxID=2071873 RepID=A0ABD6AV49_9EURY|nr:DUF4397 domain-containing protein [Halomarina rubra]